ncbi:hypothetical protein [Sorangium cellulosum]|uniref:hypothetical protein n=1 Tax=Sorangium cellulosum TaxID=56 RepID=UPI001A91166A|nr:hypothetical protein [Sorangium cellulosum]
MSDISAGGSVATRLHQLVAVAGIQYRAAAGEQNEQKSHGLLSGGDGATHARRWPTLPAAPRADQAARVHGASDFTLPIWA